jgi:hypothetical protein
VTLYIALLALHFVFFASFLLMINVYSLVTIYLQTWRLLLLSRKIKRAMFQSKIDRELTYQETVADPVLRKELHKYLDSEMSPEIYWFLEDVEAFQVSRYN